MSNAEELARLEKIKQNKEQLRRLFQRMKSMTHEQFWQEQNKLQTRAYALAIKHLSEAADITLQPKQKQRLFDKAKEIRQDWDGIRTVSIADTDNVELTEQEQGYI